MKFRLLEAEKISMLDLIAKAKEKNIQPKDIFSTYIGLGDPIKFLDILTFDRQPNYRKKAYERIELNSPGDPFYEALKSFIENKPVIKLEPAILNDENIPIDGRHRAALCDLLGIKLPVKR